MMRTATRSIARPEPERSEPEFPSVDEVRALLRRALPELHKLLLIRLVQGEELENLVLFAVADEDAGQIFVGCATHEDLAHAAQIARSVLHQELPSGYVWAMIAWDAKAPAFLPVDVRGVLAAAQTPGSA
jgi:hypothetical protein